MDKTSLSFKSGAFKYLPLITTTLAYALISAAEFLLRVPDYALLRYGLLKAAEVLEFFFFPNSLYLFVYHIRDETGSARLLWIFFAFVLLALVAVIVGKFMEWLSRRLPALVVVALYFVSSVAVWSLSLQFAFSL